MSDVLRALPAVHTVLEDERLAHLPHSLAADLVREVLAEVRAGVQSGVVDSPVDVGRVAAERGAALIAGRLRPVFNATGVVLHTNLGRAPWPAEVRAAAGRAMGTCNLELDLLTGERGGRLYAIESQCRQLLGSESAVAVNNGAAAVLLALTALARDREVLVSRGELVEIGGSFRVPDIIAACGARLVEVGTTNRTRVGDYAAAAGPNTAVILSVHRSNFEVVGFTERPDRQELVALGRQLGLPVVEDAGSGALFGEYGEPSVAEAVAAGVDVVVFSGDKLLGGPQAGLAVGRAQSIAAMRQHALYRALRLDKVSLAALEATLGRRLAGGSFPVDQMLTVPDDALRARAATLAQGLVEQGIDATVIAADGVTGGGARPGDPLTGWVVAVPGSAQRIADALRTGDPAVLARISGGVVLLDPRTLPEDALTTVVQAVARAVGPGYGAAR